MPALSPTMTQGNLSSWKKREGDAIKIGDSIALIETDKATMDLESQEDGYLAKILVPDGTHDVEISKPIAIIVEDSKSVGQFKDYQPGSVEAKRTSSAKESETAEAAAETTAEATAQGESKKPSQDSRSQHEMDKPAAEKERIHASPAAKSMARDAGMDLETIKGSGPNGRIVKADVLAQSAQLSPSSPKPGAFTDRPLTSMRKTIAKRLSESMATIPHFYLTVEINMDRALQCRAVLNAGASVRLSINDFVVKAAALALREFPAVNSSWGESSIREYHHVDICVAVSTGEGLITPIVKEADKKGLLQISTLVKELAKKAKDGALQPAEFMGGSFTISNLGMFGMQQFTAIINPPQACILAVGSAEPKVVPSASDADMFETIQVMKVTLSCDHRVVDGALGAQWLQSFKKYMEEPALMLL